MECKCCAGFYVNEFTVLRGSLAHTHFTHRRSKTTCVKALSSSNKYVVYSHKFFSPPPTRICLWRGFFFAVYICLPFDEITR